MPGNSADRKSAAALARIFHYSCDTQFTVTRILQGQLLPVRTHKLKLSSVSM
jgi:hypothetical protein